MIVVVTRLSPRGASGLRGVNALTGTVLEHLQSLSGFRGGRMLIDRRVDMWTMTTWQDRAALAAFRELHAPVMGRIDEVARASSMTAWQQDDPTLPSWTAVRARWTEGRGPARGLTRVLAPAPTRVPV